jgi:hypothetical protein
MKFGGTISDKLGSLLDLLENQGFFGGDYQLTQLHCGNW